jgi:hypothetical protein
VSAPAPAVKNSRPGVDSRLDAVLFWAAKKGDGMNLVSATSLRTVYTYREVQEFLGMTFNQVRSLVQSGKLRKRYRGKYGFDQGDINKFIHDLNHGRVTLGRGRMGATSGKSSAT